jgi:hypothetical protein
MSLKPAPGSLEQELHKRGIQAANIAKYLEEIKSMRNVKRRATGFVCMAAGAFLGFLSCVLTITHALPHLFDFIFYGLTMLAVCIVVFGMYCVFE